MIDLLLEIREELGKYYENPWAYLRIIKELVRRRDSDARVLVFGSFVKGCMRPDSDIDVLVITRLASDDWVRAGLRAEIMRELDGINPFELHIVTPEEYNGWYARFVDKWVEV